MKYLLFIVFAFMLVASCSKDSPLVNDVDDPVEELKMSNLSVAAVYAGSSSEASTSTEPLHTCSANYVPNTDIALFFEQTGITVETSAASADYRANTGSGVAYFKNLPPGRYTVLAVNDMGAKVKIRTITVGSNDISIEF